MCFNPSKRQLPIEVKSCGNLNIVKTFIVAIEAKIAAREPSHLIAKCTRTGLTFANVTTIRRNYFAYFIPISTFHNN